MLFNLCRTVIERKTYTSKEDMKNKLDVFLLNNRLTQEEYNELEQLLS